MLSAVTPLSSTGKFPCVTWKYSVQDVLKERAESDTRQKCKALPSDTRKAPIFQMQQGEGRG